MSSRWYKSLYWRIAIGFVLGLAAMLVVQAMLFVWIVPVSGPTVPTRPERFAQTVATDVADALGQTPSLDVQQFVGSQFGRNALPFLVMMNDGRVADHAGVLSDDLKRAAQSRIEGRGPEFDRGGRGRGGRGGRDDGTFDPRDRFPGPGFDGRGQAFDPRGPNFDARARNFGPPGRLIILPITVNDQRAGVVVVSPTAPFGFLLRRFAPTLTLIASSVLIVGALLAAVVIFGPARRRLRQVEDAARRLGAGDLTARAPARGGDEVAAVATAFNAMADDLSARADALAQSDRMRRQLLADVSHELTTPVTAMRGYLETLTMPEFALEEGTRARYLGIIGDETARLERIIGDLLDLAKLEGGGGGLVVGDVSIEQVFARVAARHERAAADAGVRIVTIVDPGAVTIEGDRDRLEQALQNLAANAFRYAPPHSTLELRSQRDGNDIVLSVSDEGSGIPPEHLSRVFDRFYKAEGSRSVRTAPGATAPNGSGLGLSIVKAIVERHGGSVSVESRPGRTVFTLRLPRLASSEPAAGAP
jgi:signal transduction histidine kinase